MGVVVVAAGGLEDEVELLEDEGELALPDVSFAMPVAGRVVVAGVFG